MNKYTDLIQSKELAEVFPGFQSDYGYVYSAGRDGDKWSELQLVKGLILPCSMEYGIIYAFDLSDILERLPSSISKDGNFYILGIKKMSMDDGTNMAGADFYLTNYFEECEDELLAKELWDEEDKNPLTALYSLTIWLHEQKYIGEGQNG